MADWQARGIDRNVTERACNMTSSRDSMGGWAARQRLSGILSSSVLPILCFVILSVATQTGNLMHEQIDWDESTFIIMASDVLDGHLPYLNLYDNKTPGIFFLLAPVMWLFGETLVVVRLFGDIAVLIAAGATYFICRRIAPPIESALAVAAMIAVSAIVPLQPTLTEHVVVALVMVSAWLVVGRRDALWSAFCVGLLLSVATITRLNVAFVVVALGAYYAWGFVRPRPRLHRLALFAYGAGGLVPLLALLVAYGSAGALDVLFLATVSVPFSYSQNQMSVLEVVAEHARLWVGTAVRYPGMFVPFSVLIILGGYKFCRSFFSSPLSRAVTLDETEPREVRLIVSLLFAAMLLSVLMGGAAFRHYWLQLLPFAAIFIATPLAGRDGRWESWITGALAAVLIASSLVTFGPSSLALLQGRQRLDDSHVIRQVAEQIAAHKKPGDRVFATNFQLVYWYLDQDPPSPVVTHPANITQTAVITPLVAAGYVPEDELDRLIESRPAFMIYRRDRTPPLEYDPELRSKLSDLLAREYQVWLKVNSIHVYRRIL